MSAPVLEEHSPIDNNSAASSRTIAEDTSAGYAVAAWDRLNYFGQWVCRLDSVEHWVEEGTHSWTTCYCRVKRHNIVVDLNSVLQTAVVEELLVHLEQRKFPAARNMIDSRRNEDQDH